ncbi:hypothetical protein OnM2_042073 [Erysiphe neolycopersici]|uniref:Uncharacterized protein n=1 Tax=Erysiphe neolycopersici TaxID=212602 RepID=A0A420HVR4_9PEZI|nr:hypothetical protein OnM2_042073 [Erysiphe neolycopersici]
MVALGKWSQHEIDNIFLMKYGQGMSEPQITDHIAKNYPSHQNIKVTGVRYVLRCKQPSPGIPNDPKRKQTPPAKFRSQYQICRNNMPVPLDIQEGIMSQKRLQEQFLNRQNRLSTSPQPALYQAQQDSLSCQQDPLSCQLALPLLTSFQTSHQKLNDDKDKGTTSLMNYETLGALGYAAGDFLNSIPPGVTNETQDILGYYSGAPEIILKDPSECLPPRKSSAESFLPSFHGSMGDDPTLTTDCINSNSNSRLPTPETSQNIFLPSDTVNPSMDSCFNNLTFYNEPIDDIFKEFSSIGQAETQGMPGILDSSFNQKPWDVPFKAYEQENGKEIFSDMSDPNTHLERMEIQKKHEKTCHPVASMNTGECSNSLKRHAEKIRPAKCLQKQKKNASRNFDVCYMNGNRFGGVRGSLFDNPQIIGENQICHLNPPNSSRCDQYSSYNTGLLTNAMQPNDNSKGKESLKDLRTSTINLFNPEFHEPFGLPPDTQFWAIENTEETNLTLHGSTPTGEVIINFFNPIFHSDCFISEKFVPPDHSFVKM